MTASPQGNLGSYPNLEDLIGETDEYESMEIECTVCHDTGRIVAADGYHEYLGYDYLPCPNCAKEASGRW